MPVTVAEYLGVNAATAHPAPHPQGQQPIPACPFMGQACSKIVRGEKPTCSAWADNRLWIICQDRLLSAIQTAPVTHLYLAARLREVADILWPNNAAPNTQIAVARQFRVLGSDCDYVFAIDPGWKVIPLPVRYVMEVQGGGITGATQRITQHVSRWEAGEPGVVLATPVPAYPDAYGVWKRLLVQLFTKGIAAVNARQGVGCIVGERFADWLEQRLHWSQLTVPEDGYVDFVVIPYRVTDANSSPILMAPDQDRIIRSTFKQFVDLLQQSEEAASFAGTYTDLAGQQVHAP
jgi:hypothetical protein